MTSDPLLGLRRGEALGVAASASQAPVPTGVARRPSPLRRHAPLLRGGLSILAGALLWELVARFVVRNELFMVPLSQVGQEAVKIAASGDLVRYVLVSFEEFAIGFALASVVGIALGLAMAVHSPTRDVLDPWVAGLQATPLVALGPLFVLWFGLGVASKIAVVFLVAVFSIVVNTYVGVVSTPQPLIEAARAFGARGWQLYREVLLPSATPVIVAGLRLGVARALLGVVVGELFASNQGVGYLILQSAQTYNTAALFVGVFLFAIAGVLSNRALLSLERRIAPWNHLPSQEQPG